MTLLDKPIDYYCAICGRYVTTDLYEEEISIYKYCTFCGEDTEIINNK